MISRYPVEKVPIHVYGISLPGKKSDLFHIYIFICEEENLNFNTKCKDIKVDVKLWSAEFHKETDRCFL